MTRIFLCLVIVAILSVVASYRSIGKSFLTNKSKTYNSYSKTKLLAANNKVATLFIPLGDGYQDIECKFRPLFQNSTFFVTSYDVPFGLNIDKPPKGFPAPIVSKDGTGGELKGDVLRATTCWSQGFNAAGATSDILSFAG